METRTARFVVWPLAIGLILLWIPAAQGGPFLAGPAPREAVHCDRPVLTSSGLVRGSEDEGGRSCSWKGLPYAAPPVDALRWRAPEPAETWEGVRDATEWGCDCVQSKLLKRLHSSPACTSEDCLFLNVWRPRKPGTFPVMVWFHGGAYMCGMGSSPMYMGDRLSANGDVVVVTLNYRLGAFGFLAHEALAAEDPNGSTGNYGTLDQLAALTWVQENIAAFGGDPNCVTIFGQSAGSMSVCTLMATPLAKGLFHRAIMESGGCESAWPMEKGYETGKWAARSLECPPNDLACMRSRSAKEVFKKLDISLLRFIGGSGLLYLNHTDRYVLTGTPLSMIRSGTFNNVPLIAGNVRDEVQPLVYRNPRVGFMGTHSYEERVRTHYGQDAETVLRLYPAESYGSPAKAFAAILSDRLLLCTVCDGMQAVQKYQPETFYYRFDYDDVRGGRVTGASHIMEIPFVFGNLDRKPCKWYFMGMDKSKPANLSRIIQPYWVNFAYTGNPNGSGLPLWPAYDSQNPQVLIFDDQVRTEVPTDLFRRCEFWTRYNQVHGSPFGPGQMH